MLCFLFKKTYSAEYPPDGADDNFKKKKKMLLASETQALPVMELWEIFTIKGTKWMWHF